MSSDSQKSAAITARKAFNTPHSDITSSATMTTTISEKSGTTIPPTTLNKITDVKGSLPMTASAVIYTTSLTLTTLETTVLGTVMSGSQEGKATAAPLSLTSASTMSMLSETPHSIASQTPSHAVELVPSAGIAIAQSPETTAGPSAALIPSSSGTTKSAMMGPIKLPLNASRAAVLEQGPVLLTSTQRARETVCAMTATMPTQVSLRNSC